MARVLAEAFGTFVLVLAGAGACVVNDTSGGALGHVGVSLVFGLVVYALAGALGPTSGAHLNPAVTLAAWAAGLFPAKRIPAYFAAQFLGATAAAAVLRLGYPAHPTLGGTFPTAGVGPAFVAEFLLTLVLVVVILRTGHRADQALVVGAVIGLEALVGGPVCGASMNPARSFGPAVVAGRLDTLPVYLTAPFAGALAGVFVARRLVPEESA